MPLRHALLAVTVALLWGLNFIAIDLSLVTFPPMFLVALRFALLAVPTLLFIPRPNVPWRWLIGYGLGFGVLQFGFLYWGMVEGMPPGLASLVLQASAPFTVLLGAVFFREKLTPLRGAGIGIALCGLAVVGWQRAENAALLPFLLVLAGALGWAFGNICNRQAHTTEPFKLMMWMTVVPPIPMVALSLIVEGPARIGASFQAIPTGAGLLALDGLAFTVLIATVVGSGIWTWLMSKHAAGLVAPFSLLVPVFAMPVAWLVFRETVTAGEMVGAALVIVGVLVAAWFARPAAVPTIVPAETPVSEESLCSNSDGPSPKTPASERPQPARLG